MGVKTDKTAYFERLKGLLEEYKSVFIVNVDNVSSQQMHEIRHSLRDEAVVLMGKNTMVCFSGGVEVFQAEFFVARVAD